MKNNISVYLHINPIKQEIFYVGIGDHKRPYKKSQRNIHWKRTVNLYGYQVIIIHENLSWDEACQLEIKYIAQVGRLDLGLGTLVNMTSGGEGQYGRKWTDKQRANIKLAITLNPQVAWNKGITGLYKHTEESKQKISKASTGRRHTTGTKLKIIMGNKGKKRSEETCNKISKINKGKVYSDEYKAKMSAACKGKNLGKKRSEETKAKLRLPRKPWSEETRAKMANRKTRIYGPQSEETKAKIAKTLRDKKKAS